MYKELKKLDTRESNNPIKKWDTELNKTFSVEEHRMTKKHLRKCFTSLAIKEMQIKTTLRFHLTPVRLAKIHTQMTIDAGEVGEKEEHSPLLVGLQTNTTALEISLAIPQKIGHNTT